MRTGAAKPAPAGGLGSKGWRNQLPPEWIIVPNPQLSFSISYRASMNTRPICASCVWVRARKMAEYRLYVLDDEGHVFGPAEIAKCAMDSEATELAGKRLNKFPVEVWQEARRVVRLQPNVQMKFDLPNRTVSWRQSRFHIARRNWRSTREGRTFAGHTVGAVRERFLLKRLPTIAERC